MANRQEIVCNYIYENYVQFDRLRHDVISNKTQINVQRDNVQGTKDWRDITTADVNDIVCDCSAQNGLQITAREVLAVLQSHRVPDVHPLREYVQNCRPYTDDQPDWIAWLAEQVKVSGDESEQQLFSVYFDIPAAGYGQFMTTAEISDKLVIKGSIKKPMPLNRLGMLLKKAGYRDVRRGEQRTRGWIVYERTFDEVNANRNKKE